MKEANEILVEYQLGGIKDNDVVCWACDCLLSDCPLSTNMKLIQLAALKRIQPVYWGNKVEQYLKDLVAYFFADFKIPSFETELYARKLLREKCAAFLSGTLQNPTEIFIVATNIAKVFFNPVWLGNLLLMHGKYLESNWFDEDLLNEIVQRLSIL